MDNLGFHYDFCYFNPVGFLCLRRMFVCDVPNVDLRLFWSVFMPLFWLCLLFVLRFCSLLSLVWSGLLLVWG